MKTSKLSDAEQQIDRRRKTCVYFNGIQHDCCDLHISYESVQPVQLTVKGPLRLPCLNPHVMICDSRIYPTEEQLQQHERDILHSIEQVGKALESILLHSKGKRGITGIIDCPCCDGGLLHYTVARSNGHIHASCSTSNCVRFME